MGKAKKFYLDHGGKLIWASFVFALLLALLFFMNSRALLQDISIVLFGAVIFYFIGRFLLPSRFARGGIWWASVLLSICFVLIFLPNRQTVALHLFQFVFLWFPLLFIAGLPWFAGRWKQVLVAIVSIALSLLVIHLAGPFLLKEIILPTFELDVDHRPNSLPGVTNEDGIQPDIPASAYKEEDFNIIVLGDSYAFGAKLEDIKKSFPFVVQKELRRRFPDRKIRVANFGNPGSSPVLQVKGLREKAARYKPDLVVHQIGMPAFADDIRVAKYLQNQEEEGPKEVTIWQVMELRLSMLLGVPDLRKWLKENYAYAKPPREPEPVKIKKKSKYEDIFQVADNLPYYFHLRQPLEKSEPLMRITWDAILKTRQEAKNLGAEYALFVFPRCQQYDKNGCPVDHVNPHGGQIPKDEEYLFEPFRYFDQRAESAGFPIHSLLPDFKVCGVSPTTFPDDPHFNEDGHRVAGKAIVQYLISDGLVGDAQ